MLLFISQSERKLFCNGWWLPSAWLDYCVRRGDDRRLAGAVDHALLKLNETFLENPPLLLFLTMLLLNSPLNQLLLLVLEVLQLLFEQVLFLALKLLLVKPLHLFLAYQFAELLGFRKLISFSLEHDAVLLLG